MFILLLTEFQANNTTWENIRSPTRERPALVSIIYRATGNKHLKRSVFYIFFVHCVSFLAIQSAKEHKPGWWIALRIGCLNILIWIKYPEFPGAKLISTRGLPAPLRTGRLQAAWPVTFTHRNPIFNSKTDINKSAWLNPWWCKCYDLVGRTMQIFTF